MYTFVLPENQKQDRSSWVNLYWYVRQQNSVFGIIKSLLMCPSRQHRTVGYYLSGRCATVCLSCPTHFLLCHPFPPPTLLFFFFFFFKLPVWTRQRKPTGGSWWSSNPVSFSWVSPEAVKAAGEESGDWLLSLLWSWCSRCKNSSPACPWVLWLQLGKGVILPFYAYSLLFHHLYFLPLFMP